MPRSVLAPAVLAAGLLAAGPASAAAPADLCRRAAVEAADRHGVPREIMLAITLTETRRRGDPWPWTLNVEGRGHWFEARADALAHARGALAAGRRSVDVGCFQINTRWHGHNFASLEEMIAPRRAADYAAAWLSELHAEAGDWMTAAGHYHSRTPRHARRYRRMLARALEEVGAEEATAALSAAPRPSAARDGNAQVRDARRASRGRGLFAARPAGGAAPLVEVMRRPPARGPASTPGAVRLTGLGRAAAPLIGQGAPAR